MRAEMRMVYTEAGPWEAGPTGVNQRVAYVLRCWIHDEGLSREAAAARLRTDSKWPHHIAPPFSATTIQNYAGGDQEKNPAAKGAKRQRIEALCQYLNVSPDWVLYERGGMRSGATWSTVEFETELARRVLAEMPDDAPRAAGERERQVAVVGAECLRVAVEAAREEWDRTKAVSEAHAKLSEVYGWAMFGLKALSGQDGARAQAQRLREGFNALTEIVGAQGFTIFRPFPQESDYTTAAELFPGSQAYGFKTACPPGLATRVVPTLRYGFDRNEDRKAKAMVKAAQQAEEAQRRADNEQRMTEAQRAMKSKTARRR